MTPTETESLRDEIEAAVIAEVERVGPDALNKAALFSQFKARGASRASIYRWIDAPLKSGKAAMRLTAQIRKDAAARAAAVPDPALDAAREAAQIIPVPAMSDIAGYGGTVAFIAKLRQIMQTADSVAKHATHDDGKPRNAKLLLQATETLRRAMETGLKLHQAMREISEVDRFLAAIIEVLRQESPIVAERVVKRLNQLAAEWGAI